MLRTALLLTLVVFALGTSAVVAQTMEATPIPLAPKPNLAPVAYFVGTWSCSFKSSRRPTPVHSTLVASFDPSGRWLIEKTTSKPTSWFPHVQSAVDWITYDADAKRWADVETDNLGGYDLSVSPGWTGNTMVWKDLAFVPTGKVASQSLLVQTKVNATTFTWANSFVTGKGRTVGVKTVCTKV